MDELIDDSNSKFVKHGSKLRSFLNNPENRGKHSVYDYQRDAAQFMFDNFAIGNENAPDFGIGMIVGPTACGKSGIINLLPYYLEALRACILTPSKDISQQIEQSFRDDTGHNRCFFKQCGILTGERKLAEFLEPVLLVKDPNDIFTTRNLVIVNAQRFGGQSRTSLTHNDKEIVDNVVEFFKKFDLLIVDEAHHYPARTWRNIVDAFRNHVEGIRKKKIVFLTATPWRNIRGQERCVLDEFPNWETKIYTIEENICRGITTRPTDFHEPKHDFDGVETLYNDIERLFRENESLAPLLNLRQQALVLVRTVDEARELAKGLNAFLDRTDYAVPIVSGKDRGNLDKLTIGNFCVGVTCGVGTEGYDNANITVCVILRNIRTARVLFSQFIGRCMRLSRIHREHLYGNLYQGTVLSYRKFHQERLWRERGFIAEDDPVENE